MPSQQDVPTGVARAPWTTRRWWVAERTSLCQVLPCSCSWVTFWPERSFFAQKCGEIRFARTHRFFPTLIPFLTVFRCPPLCWRSTCSSFCSSPPCTCHSLPSLLQTRRAQNPNQPRLLSTSYNSWHSMSRAMRWLKAAFATSQS